MDVEGPEIIPPKVDGRAGPAISLWWLVLVLVAESGAFGLLGEAFHRLLGVVSDRHTGMSALIVLVVIAGIHRPLTFRELGLVAAVGAAAGTLAMLCYLPVAVFATSLEPAAPGSLLRVLGMVVAAGLGALAAHRAFRRLGVPSLFERAGKDRS